MAENQHQDAGHQAAADRSRGAIITFKWLEKHIDDFDRTPANVQKIVDFMLGKTLDWTEESLELSLQALIEAGEILPTVAYNEEPEPSAVVIEEPERNFPWGYELTAEDLQTMRASEFRRWLTNRTYRSEFQRQVKNAQRDAAYLIRRHF